MPTLYGEGVLMPETLIETMHAKRNLLRCEAAGSLTGLADYLRGKKDDPATHKTVCAQLLIAADEYLEGVKRLNEGL